MVAEQLKKNILYDMEDEHGEGEQEKYTQLKQNAFNNSF